MNQLPRLQDEELPKLSIKEISDEGFKFFNLEKGLIFTFIAVLRRPLETVNTYLNKDRRKYSNPLQFILIAVGLYTAIISYHKGFQSFLDYTEAENKKNFALIEKQFSIQIAEPIAQAQDIIFSYQNVLYLLIIPAISLITYKLFSKKYNYAENLAINAYIFGTSTWVAIILALLTLVAGYPIIVFASLSIISFAIITYLYKMVFETSWLKGLGTMMLVYILIMIITTIIQFGLVAIYML